MLAISREEVVLGLYILNHCRTTPPTMQDYMTCIKEGLKPQNNTTIRILKEILPLFYNTDTNKENPKTCSKFAIMKIIAEHVENDFTRDKQFEIITKYYLIRIAENTYKFVPTKISAKQLAGFFKANLSVLAKFADINFKVSSIDEFLSQFDKKAGYTYLISDVITNDRYLNAAYCQLSDMISEPIVDKIKYEGNTHKNQPVILADDSMMSGISHPKLLFKNRYPFELLNLVVPDVSHRKDDLPGIINFCKTALDNPKLQHSDKRGEVYRHQKNYLLREAFLDAAFRGIILPIKPIEGVKNMNEFKFTIVENQLMVGIVNEHIDHSFVFDYTDTPHLFCADYIDKSATDLIGSERDQYFLRKVDTTNVCYYGKELEISSDPETLMVASAEVLNVVDMNKPTTEVYSYKHRLVNEMFSLGLFDTTGSVISPVDLTKCATRLLLLLTDEAVQYSPLNLCRLLKTRDGAVFLTITDLITYNLIVTTAGYPNNPEKKFDLKLNMAYFGEEKEYENKAI